LSSLARSLRHAFAKSGGLLASRGFLLESRDAAGDVGADRWRAGVRRTALADLLFANFRRVQESARVLEESARLAGKPRFARRLQALRYRAYALEKMTWLSVGRR
jgi:thiamine-phosphate pyrophosphorylase